MARAVEGFTGRPSIVTVIAVAALRVVRVITDFLGVDLGTQLAPLIATSSPPWFLALGINVQRMESDGMPVWKLQSGQPSGKCVVAIHGGAYIVQPTLIHWLDYSLVARTTGATVVVPIYPLAPRGNAASVVLKMADLVSAVIDERESQNVSYTATQRAAAWPCRSRNCWCSAKRRCPPHGSAFAVAGRH
jgi:acetyl esterase/lipase